MGAIENFRSALLDAQTKYSTLIDNISDMDRAVDDMVLEFEEAQGGDEEEIDGLNDRIRDLEDQIGRLLLRISDLEDKK